MNTSSAATKAQLFQEMYAKGSVLNGWSAVLNINGDYLARRVRNQWPMDQAGTHSVTLLSAQPLPPGPGVANAMRGVGQMTFVLGEPQISVVHGRSALAISHPVQQVLGRSGKATTMPTAADAASVAWDTDSAVNVPAHPAARVDIEVPLVVRPAGSGASGFDIVLDTAAASAAAHHLPAAAGDGGALVQHLVNVLGDSNGKLLVATVDDSTQADTPALQPRSLALLTVRTPGGNQVLQVHFATGDTPAPTGTGVDLGEPLPVVDGADWSLMFSSQKVFQDVVAPEFNTLSQHVKLAAAAPPAGHGAWFLQTQNRMYFAGTVDWGNAMPPVSQQAQIGLNFIGSPNEGLVVSTYTDPGANVDLQFDIAQNYPVKCSGNPGQQTLSFAGTQATVAGAGVAENTFKPYLDQILSQEIRSDLDATSLASLAAFALRTVRFPGDETVIDAVQIPGDLVMVGNFDPDTKA
ncbi:hypothetical protein ACFFJT_18345 [Dyella flava]|uniref:Uncharacterized protein n=1 Tax=Dyella flava TaxID=1920170 RepID=A0ABS2K124_9GAMM|nr:hypothetical protein [Dyella flava]MBM7124437.1 hypothetical protein [Dyella flava]GLQ51902.1 hypothetical protein GCM10010872_33510 [Dyella flava]